jgi:hypothetical protein
MCANGINELAEIIETLLAAVVPEQCQTCVNSLRSHRSCSQTQALSQATPISAPVRASYWFRRGPVPRAGTRVRARQSLHHRVIASRQFGRKRSRSFRVGPEHPWRIIRDDTVRRFGTEDSLPHSHCGANADCWRPARRPVVIV